MEKILKKIGLTNNEIKLYLGLFEIGSATASKIAEKNKLHRTNAYDYLDRLMKKGLVSCTVKDKVKYYNATDPNSLISFIDRSKEELESNRENVKEVVKQLKKIKPRGEVVPRIETFQGKSGLESFYEKLIEIAASMDEVLIIGSSEMIMEVFNYYLLNLTKKIVKIKVRVKMIANKEIMKSRYMRVILRLINIKMKYVSRAYLSPTATFVFKDYVGFCNFMENPYVILVNDGSISNSYKKHFEMMWEKSEKR